MVTSLPIVGGITASGVFLLFISVVGLVGAMKHHQVMLFFYMLVLFFIFIIQFSCSCAALSVSEDDQRTILKEGWDVAPNTLKKSAEQTFHCCGLGINPNGTYYDHPTKDDHDWSMENKVFNEGEDCYEYEENEPKKCFTCHSTLQSKVNSGFHLAGGLGLFFSFPEFIGMWLAARFRNQKDPRLNPSAFF